MLQDISKMTYKELRGTMIRHIIQQNNMILRPVIADFPETGLFGVPFFMYFENF